MRTKNTKSKKTVAKKATTKKAAPKKSAPKKTAAKKTAPKKSATKKTAAKKTTTKKAAPKKSTAKKTAAKKTTTKKAAPKKSTAKKKTTKKAAPKRSAANKTITKRKRKKIINKPTVRYSDADLEIFKKRILEMKQEALEELLMLKERLDDLNNFDFAEESMIYSMHMAEQGSEAMEKEKTYAQIQRINEYIKKLDEALERIKIKTYGICRVCHCLIAKERLLAVPVTTLSASYKIHKKCPEDGIDRIEPLK